MASDSARYRIMKTIIFVRSESFLRSFFGILHIYRDLSLYRQTMRHSHVYYAMWGPRDGSKEEPEENRVTGLTDCLGNAYRVGNFAAKRWLLFRSLKVCVNKPWITDTTSEFSESSSPFLVCSASSRILSHLSIQSCVHASQSLTACRAVTASSMINSSLSEHGASKGS